MMHCCVSTSETLEIISNINKMIKCANSVNTQWIVIMLILIWVYLGHIHEEHITFHDHTVELGIGLLFIYLKKKSFRASMVYAIIILLIIHI